MTLQIVHVVLLPKAPSSDTALGLPLVAGAFDPGVEWARGEVAGPSLFGTEVFWVLVE